MVRLVDDLMEVSRITCGKIALSKAPTPIADILASAIETSQPAIEQARHELTLSLPEQPMILDADRIRLTQVFTNLLNNAARYTHVGGHIWVTASRDGDSVAVTVRDNGIGIPHDRLPHVFEMFAQVHGAAEGHQGGLGIGLTMVRNLVEMHGGTVDVRSAGPGQGSEFIVRLPLFEASSGALADEQRSTAQTAAPLSGRRILVVDDNRDAADSLCMLLTAQGAEASVAYDGRSALAALEPTRPHTVILDIGMPGMDGYELARHIRQQAQFSAIQIIALTGWGHETDRVHSRSSGIDFHLTKPVDLKALEDLLASAACQ
jgi:CheY-like chemotaxis protein